MPQMPDDLLKKERITISALKDLIPEIARSLPTCEKTLKKESGVGLPKPPEDDLPFPIRKSLRDPLAEKSHPLTFMTEQEEEQNGDVINQVQDRLENTQR